MADSPNTLPLPKTEQPSRRAMLAAAAGALLLPAVVGSAAASPSDPAFASLVEELQRRRDTLNRLYEANRVLIDAIPRPPRKDTVAHRAWYMQVSAIEKTTREPVDSAYDFAFVVLLHPVKTFAEVVTKITIAEEMKVFDCHGEEESDALDAIFQDIKACAQTIEVCS